MASHLPSLTLKLALLDRGIESFHIGFENTTGVYNPGDTLHGHVFIHLKDSIKARAVAVSIYAKARTRWTLWEQYSSNRSTHSEAIPYMSEETYIDEEKIVWHGQEALPAGLHRFPFVFTLPAECPPSFEGTIGFIRYYCKAKIDRPWKFDDTTRQAFTVLPHFDLNTIYYAALPAIRSLSKPIGMLCLKHGVIETKISLSKNGYVPGESVVLSAEIHNNSSKNVARIETALLEVVTYTAKRGKPALPHYGFGHRYGEVEKKVEVRTVVQYIEDFKVPRNSQSSYMRMLAIPPIAPSFNICPIIQVKIITKGGFRQSIAGELPILIGTIPVRNRMPPQQQSIPTPDYLIPPKPSKPPKVEFNPPPSYVECIFGKGTVEEEKEDKALNFTPKYIYYSGLK